MYKQKVKVAMVIGLIISSVSHSIESVFAQSESIAKEYSLTDEKIEMEVLENKGSIQHVEKVVGDVELNEQNFPDPVFREYISNNYDSDNDGTLSSDEINKVTNIYLYGKKDIKSIKGIEYFLNLMYLSCCYTGITSLDVSKNPALKNLRCDNTNITSLDVSKNLALENLECNNTNITSIDVSNNSVLKELNCNYTGITSIDVSNNLMLESLWCYTVGITSIDVSNNLALKDLDCGNTGVTSIDVSNNSALESLCFDETGIISIDVSKNPALWYLDCNSTKITSLDISQNPDLKTLLLDNTNITSIDVSKNLALRYLTCNNTNITSLDISNNLALENLECKNTKIIGLDISSNTALSSLRIESTNLAWLNIGNNSKLSQISRITSMIHLGEVEETFNIVDTLPGIDLNKITITSGASLDKNTGIVSGYTNGTPITYTYDCGTIRGSTLPLYVTLNFAKKKEESTIIIHDDLNKIYDGTAVGNPTDFETVGSTGEVIFEWYTANGIRLQEAPVHVGNYKVKAILVEDANYKSAEAEKDFTITKANNEWIVDLAIQDWVYGESAKEPSADAQFGLVEFTYSGSKDGVYTAEIPRDAGTYWVKATVRHTNDYEGLEVKKAFTIEKANSMITIDSNLNRLFDGIEVDNPQVSVIGSTGEVIFEWYTADGIKLQTPPMNVGSYKVKAILAGDENHEGAEVEKTFEITKATNQWKQELDIQGWVYGEIANNPSVEVQFGTIEFTYSTLEDGVYTTEIPTDAGAYWIKATVIGTNDYEGIEVKKAFTIAKASSMITIHHDLNKIYDGQAVIEPSITQIGSQSVPVYEWYVKNEEVTRNTIWTKLTGAPSEVGNYKLVITVSEDKNYHGVTKEVEFCIKEAQQDIPSVSEDIIDNEESHVITGNQVQTGDGTQVGLWTMLVGLSTGLMIYFRRKNHKEER